MFWIERLSEDTVYCTCQGAWNSIKIITTIVKDNLLEVFLTPEDGNKCLLFSLKRGQTLQNLAEFSIAPLQHVKIDVVGGEITLIGQSDEDIFKRRATFHFYGQCIYGNEEDWNREKTQVEREIRIIEQNKREEL